MKALDRNGRARFASAFVRACLCAGLCTMVAGGAHAQAGGAVNVVPSRDTLEQAARDGCDDASVVVQRCLDRPNVAPTQAPSDALDRSRERAKAAFDRRLREQQKRAQDGKADAVAPSGGDATVLAPVTVTGTATAAPTPPEEVIEKALNPNDPATRVLANGNTVTYDADGNRVECQAHCVGPMCCKQLRARPNPAQLSNGIGR